MHSDWLLKLQIVPAIDPQQGHGFQAKVTCKFGTIILVKK